MITGYLSDKIQNFLFGLITYEPPQIYYLGLSQTPIAYNGTGALEPSNEEYNRMAIPNNKTYWSTSANGIIRNNLRVSFPEAVTNWGVYSYIFIADALEGGNILYSSELNMGADVLANTQLFFDSNSLEFSALPSPV